MARSAKQKAALRKAQLASARKRKGKSRGTSAQRRRKYKRAAGLGAKIVAGGAVASLVGAHFKAGGKFTVTRARFKHQGDTPLRVFSERTVLGRSREVGYQRGNNFASIIYSTRRQRARAERSSDNIRRMRYGNA